MKISDVKIHKISTTMQAMKIRDIGFDTYIYHGENIQDFYCSKHIAMYIKSISVLNLKQ